MTNKHSSKGIYLIWFAFLTPIFIGILALVIDYSLMRYSHNKLQSVVNSAALLATMQLHPHLESSSSERLSLIQSYIIDHPISGITIESVIVTEGYWNGSTSTFTPNSLPWNALSVSVTAQGDYYFAGIFNLTNYTMTIDTLSTYSDSRPLAIAVLFDSSTNMSLASRLDGIQYVQGDYSFSIDDQVIEERLMVIDNELRNPVITPEPPYERPPYGALTQTNQFISGDISLATTISDLALNISYPYSGDGARWNDYVSYVKGSSIPLTYKNYYGMQTLINYWQEVTHTADQVPNLKYVSQYPLTYIKNNTSYFLSHLGTEDAVVGVIRLNTSVLQATPTTNSTLDAVIKDTPAGHTIGDNDTGFDVLLDDEVQGQLQTFFNQTPTRYKRVLIVICTFSKCGGITDLGPKATSVYSYIKQQNLSLYYLPLGISTGQLEYEAIVESYGGLGSFLGDSAAIPSINISDSEYKSAIDEVVTAMKRTLPYIVSNP